MTTRDDEKPPTAEGRASTSPLHELIDRQTLREMAGAQSFGRGEDYFFDGRVRNLAEDRGKIAAEVRGTEVYRVALWAEDGGLEYSCSCPLGHDGVLCKHCVAVGLAWLDPAGAKPKQASKREKPSVTMDDVRAWPADRDKSKLVDMLMEQAREDGRLRQRLTLEVARSGAKGIDLRTYRRAVDVAVDAGDFVDYKEAFDYAHGIGEAVKGIEELLRDGHASEAIELSEYALERVEGAIEHVDDSGGHMGGILEQLQTLHFAACKQAEPDPVALAKRLFAWELRTSWDTFYGAATYADVLGQKGLATYRELAEAEWVRVPSRGPADALRPGSYRYSRITHIMEILAEQAGDVYRELGDAAAAEAAYRHALDMTPADRPRYDRDGAVERLICILDETGRSEEANALIESEKARTATMETAPDVLAEENPEDAQWRDAAPSPDYVPAASAMSPGTMVRKEPKVGGNDPCPCSRKFKRCCGS